MEDAVGDENESIAVGGKLAKLGNDLGQVEDLGELLEEVGEDFAPISFVGTIGVEIGLTEGI